MSITPERKQALIGDYAVKSGDTGSPEVQVAILSELIKKTSTPAVVSWSWSASGGACSTTSSEPTASATKS